jgi:hypothetical protein
MLPTMDALIVPSRYGQKYLYGLVKGSLSQVFVIRGVGTIDSCADPGCSHHFGLNVSLSFHRNDWPSAEKSVVRARSRIRVSLKPTPIRLIS